MSARKPPVCHFLLPGLTEAVAILSGIDEMQLHSLETAMTRGTQSIDETSHESLLAKLFELDTDTSGNDVPIAALLAQKHVPEDLLKSHQWVRASPVNLVPDRDKLVLHLPRQHQKKSISEWLAPVSADFLEIFSDVIDELIILEDCLLLRLHGAESFTTTPLNKVVGRPVDALLPSGNVALKWNAILNEMQMLLHEKGAPETGFNAFWLDGCGSLPEPVPGKPVLSSGEDQLLEGLSMWQRGEYCSGLEDIEGKMLQVNQLVLSEQGLSRALQARSEKECIEAIIHADEILGRMLKWLDSGKLAAIHLHLLDGWRYSIKKPALWSFLKKKKRLSRLRETLQ